MRTEHSYSNRFFRHISTALAVVLSTALSFGFCGSAYGATGNIVPTLAKEVQDYNMTLESGEDNTGENLLAQDEEFSSEIPAYPDVSSSEPSETLEALDSSTASSGNGEDETANRQNAGVVGSEPNSTTSVVDVSGEAENASSMLEDSERPIADGIYAFSVHSQPNLVLEATSSSNGSELRLQRANGYDAQLFSIVWEAKSEAYICKALFADKVMAVSGMGVSNGASVVLWDDNSTSNMRWSINELPSGGYAIASVDTGLIIDCAADIPQVDAGAVVWERTGSLKQGFDFVERDAISDLNKVFLGPRTIEDGVYSIECCASANLALDIYYGRTANGTNVALWNKGSSINQKYYVMFEPVDGDQGYYTVQALCSGKVLAVSGDGSTRGSSVVQWEDNATPNMRWIIRPESGGGYSLASSDGGLVLDVAGDIPNAGSDVVVWERTGSQKQWFSFSHERVVEDGYYAIHPQLRSDLTVAINGSSNAQGANTVLSSDATQFASKYHFLSNDDGTYTIRSLLTGMVLDVSSEGKVVQLPASGAMSQHWAVLPNGYGGFSLSAVTQVVGTVRFWTGGYYDVGGSIWAQDAATSNADQSFTFEPVNLVSDGLYTMRVAGDAGYAVSMSKLSLDSGASYCTAYVRDYAMQQFNVVNQGKDVVQLVSPLAGKALCVGYGSSRGASVIQWSNNGTDNMKWQVIPTYQGSVYLQNVASGMNLDYAADAPSQLASLVVWDPHGADKQKFVFVPTVYNPPRNVAVVSSAGGYLWFDGSGNVNRDAAVGKILDTAHSLLGVPYVWLGVYPQDGGMDCASFTWYLYRQLGIDIGFETYDQMYSGYSVASLSLAKPGDLILMYYGSWPNYDFNLPEHVVLYAGNGMIYEEPTFGGHCQYVSLFSKGATKIDIRRIIR